MRVANNLESIDNIRPYPFADETFIVVASMPIEQQLILVLQTGAFVSLALRLWWTGLYRSYPCFWSYLLLGLFQSVVMAQISFYSRAYRDAWLFTESVMLCAHFLVVLELCKVILRDLHGITTVARRYLKWTMALAVISSLLLLKVERVPVTLMSYFLTCERAIMSSLVIFVLLLMFFLVYYPVPLNQNVIAYSIGYAVYFMTKAVALLVRNLGPVSNRQLSTILVSISTACLLFWLLVLSRRGETRAIVVGHQWSVEQEEHLLSQLRSVNASLTRVVPTFQRRAAQPDEAD